MCFITHLILLITFQQLPMVPGIQRKLFTIYLVPASFLSPYFRRSSHTWPPPAPQLPPLRNFSLTVYFPLTRTGCLPQLHSSVQWLSHLRLFATSWTTARHASLTNSWSLPKLTSIESMMPSNISSSVIPFSSHLQSFPASGSFPMSQFFASGGQSIGVSAATSVLPMNIQD